MKKSQLTGLLSALLPAVRGFVLDELRQRDERIAQLEAQVKAMPPFKYRGVWSGEQEYAPGDVVTDHGSMWFCSKATAARPGDSQSSSWTLAVKAGRDSRR